MMPGSKEKSKSSKKKSDKGSSSGAKKQPSSRKPKSVKYVDKEADVNKVLKKALDLFTVRGQGEAVCFQLNSHTHPTRQLKGRKRKGPHPEKEEYRVSVCGNCKVGGSRVSTQSLLRNLLGKADLELATAQKARAVKPMQFYPEGDQKEGGGGGNLLQQYKQNVPLEHRTDALGETYKGKMDEGTQKKSGGGATAAAKKAEKAPAPTQPKSDTNKATAGGATTGGATAATSPPGDVPERTADSTLNQYKKYVPLEYRDSDLGNTYKGKIGGSTTGKAEGKKSGMTKKASKTEAAKETAKAETVEQTADDAVDAYKADVPLEYRTDDLGNKYKGGLPGTTEGAEKPKSGPVHEPLSEDPVAAKQTEDPDKDVGAYDEGMKYWKKSKAKEEALKDEVKEEKDTEGGTAAEQAEEYKGGMHYWKRDKEPSPVVESAEGASDAASSAEAASAEQVAAEGEEEVAEEEMDLKALYQENVPLEHRPSKLGEVYKGKMGLLSEEKSAEKATSGAPGSAKSAASGSAQESAESGSAKAGSGAAGSATPGSGAPGSKSTEESSKSSKSKTKSKQTKPMKMYSIESGPVIRTIPSTLFPQTETSPIYQSGSFLGISAMEFVITAFLLSRYYALPKAIFLAIAGTAASQVISLAIYETRKHLYDDTDNLVMVALFSFASMMTFLIYHMIKFPKCHSFIVPMNGLESIVTALATFGFFSFLKPL